MNSRSPFGMVRRLFLERRLITPLLIFFLGYALLFLPVLTDLPLEEFIKERGPRFIGYGLTMIGGIWLYFELFGAYFRNKRDDSFSDVDARRRGRDQANETNRILSELKELKQNQQSVDYEKLEALVKESAKLKSQDRKERFKSFEEYFDSLSSILEEQAQTADEKASILLDKGTAYSRNGILFFLATIIAWQVVAIIYGFEPQHIYGIVSCSLLFVFIEFLSAWFLKQYRHYVDTSTYLIKVKSIFDRYMLAYLASADSDEEQRKYSSLINSTLSSSITVNQSLRTAGDCGSVVGCDLRRSDSIAVRRRR